MDKKIINQKTAKTVKFMNFLFMPHFNIGSYNGEFALAMKAPEMEDSIGITSAIIDIHEIDGVVYVETLHSLYKLDGSERIMHLDAVKKYLKGEMTSEEFYKDHVANQMITSRGWKVY